MTTTKARPVLPQIVRFEGVRDSGEFGAATCPHCGADGRYVYSFRCADDPSRLRGAMAGCLKFFPVSPIAKAHAAVLDKVRAGKRLNGWDEKIAAACEAFYDGTADEATTLLAIEDQARSRRAWVAKKYGRR